MKSTLRTMQTKLFSHTSRKNSSRCTIWATVAIVSLLINLIVVLPYIKPCHDIIVQKMALKSRFNEKTPDKELLNTVCRATLDHSGVKMSMNEPKGLPLDLISQNATPTPATTTTRPTAMPAFHTTAYRQKTARLWKASNRRPHQCMMRKRVFLPTTLSR